jgi:ATPase subunit of ABC transporter with duplicated ATPase domains
VLTEALRDYEGAVVAITHNREFARLLQPTHIVSVVDGASTSQ